MGLANWWSEGSKWVKDTAKDVLDGKWDNITAIQGFQEGVKWAKENKQ